MARTAVLCDGSGDGRVFIICTRSTERNGSVGTLLERSSRRCANCTGESLSERCLRRAGVRKDLPFCGSPCASSPASAARYTAIGKIRSRRSDNSPGYPLANPPISAHLHAACTARSSPPPSRPTTSTVTGPIASFLLPHSYPTRPKSLPPALSPSTYISSSPPLQSPCQRSTHSAGAFPTKDQHSNKLPPCGTLQQHHDSSAPVRHRRVPLCRARHQRPHAPRGHLRPPQEDGQGAMGHRRPLPQRELQGLLALAQAQGQEVGL